MKEKLVKIVKDKDLALGDLQAAQFKVRGCDCAVAMLWLCCGCAVDVL